jgi:DNA-binding transcriptional LysR family regulator
VDLDERHSHYDQSTWLARHVPRERITYRSNSLLGLLAATRAGWGIGVHSCFLGHRDRRLVAILPDIKVAESDLWLVTHSDLRRSRRIQTVYEFLSDLVSAHGAELASGIALPAAFHQ